MTKHILAAALIALTAVAMPTSVSAGQKSGQKSGQAVHHRRHHHRHHHRHHRHHHHSGKTASGATSAPAA